MRSCGARSTELAEHDGARDEEEQQQRRPPHRTPGGAQKSHTQSLRAGASGFLLKDTGAADLLAGIRVVAAGNAPLAPSVTRRLIAAFGALPRPSRTVHRTLAGVTEREREILVLIARGLSNTDIAAGLTLSVATVKSHIGRLLTKLNARDRAQLVIVAYETGLVTAAPARPGG